MNENKKQVLRIALVSIALIFLAFSNTWLQEPYRFMLYFIVYIAISLDIFQGAFRHILEGEWFDENILMIVATLGAFFIKEYHEGIMVMLLFQIGELLQDIAIQKSKRSIQNLLDLQEEYAWMKVGTQWQKTAVADVPLGAHIQVKVGERIPLDGELISAKADLDTSAITGEALPQHFEKGACLHSGSINEKQPIELRTVCLSQDSTTAKMIRLVQEAQNKKAKSEIFIRKFARVYTPIVLALAFFLAIIPPLLFHGVWQTWIYRALIFLVISCPCALVISIPLSFFAGIGASSKQGILFKGSQYIERLLQVKTLVFDKTGTLTDGSFQVSKAVAENGNLAQLYQLAVSLEAQSNHPIAQSIVKANRYGVLAEPLTDVQELSGYGMLANYQGQKLLLGNEALMTKYKVLVPQVKEAGTVLYMALAGQYYGYFLITDTIRKSAYPLFQYLKVQGIQTALVTGDRKESAQSVSQRLGIDQVKASCLPEDKVLYVQEKIKEEAPGEAVSFIGDGFNDAPVIANADLGISLGGVGSQAALEAADIVFMDADLSKFIKAHHLSRRIIHTVKANIIFAVVTKVLFLFLAAFGLIAMEGAIFADVGVTLIAILNASRLLKIKK